MEKDIRFTKTLSKEQFLDKAYMKERSAYFNARYADLAKKFCGRCDTCAAEGYQQGQFFGTCCLGNVPEEIKEEFSDLL